MSECTIHVVIFLSLHILLQKTMCVVYVAFATIGYHCIHTHIVNVRCQAGSPDADLTVFLGKL